MSERVTRELLVPAPIEAVWREIIGGGWLAEEVELDLRPGGAARFRSAEGDRSGWIEEARPPGRRSARLAFWWEREGAPATRVELSLTAEADETTLVRVCETRPLDALDLIATPLPGQSGNGYGPVLLAA
jgi:uncharacterized protein YndB with AHSA1/START domain